MNLPHLSITPTAPAGPTLVSPGAKTLQRALTAHMTKHGAALTALLDACHGSASGDRARALAALAAQTDPDPAAACATAARLREDLLDIQIAPIAVAPHKLGGIAPETLDAAVHFHGARLDDLLTALCPRHLEEP